MMKKYLFFAVLCFVALSCSKTNDPGMSDLAGDSNTMALKSAVSTTSGIASTYIDGPQNVAAGASSLVYKLENMPEGYSVTWTVIGEASLDAGQGTNSVFVSIYPMPNGSPMRVGTVRATLSDGVNPPVIKAKKIFITAPCNGQCP